MQQKENANMNTSTRTLDLRRINKSAWGRNIANLIDVMQKDEGFVIVSDSDPKPLIEIMIHDWSHSLRLEYLEQGTPLWKLKLNKVGEVQSKEGCCGCCGDD